MDNDMYHNGRKIREYFAWKTMTRLPHPFYPQDPLLYNFWFFACAKERMKDQIISSEDDLNNKLAEVWETFGGDILGHCFTGGYQGWNW
jgi:hypothetical protein